MSEDGRLVSDDDQFVLFKYTEGFWKDNMKTLLPIVFY